MKEVCVCGIRFIHDPSIPHHPDWGKKWYTEIRFPQMSLQENKKLVNNLNLQPLRVHFE